MNFKKLFTLSIALFGVVISFTSCGKDDGAIPNNVSIIDIPAITTNKDASASANITLASPGSFAGRFTALLYFAGAPQPERVDIVVRKTNGTTINNNNVKVFSANITALPVTLNVTVAQIEALFGAPIALRDNYDFAPDIYVKGVKYEAFPLVGAGTGAGVRAMPLFNEFARYTVQ